MHLKEVAVEGYRSLKDIRFRIEPLSVLVGRNAAGKTNIYRALALLQAAADGTICRRIAEEGGVESVLWAGPREKLTQRLVLGAQFDDLEYRIEVGLPGLAEDALDMEPMVRSERLTLAYRNITVMLLERKGPLLWLRDDRGNSQRHERKLLASETALASIRDGGRYPELAHARQALQSWRFYHDIRTDEDAPVRVPSLAISAPTLSSDGSDLAGVFATLAYVKQDMEAVKAAIEDAFPGAELSVSALDGRCRFAMRFPDMDRPFAAHELSDGTLRYLYLMGALLGYRLPPFIAINEPEASLHQNLLPPLARLIARTAERSQVWIVTHSEMLAAHLAHCTGVMPRLVKKVGGATTIGGITVEGMRRELGSI
jgi:predicted ATPase